MDVSMVKSYPKFYRKRLRKSIPEPDKRPHEDKEGKINEIVEDEADLFLEDGTI